VCRQESSQENIDVDIVMLRSSYIVVVVEENRLGKVVAA
jgi:hypothetical protein